MKKKELILIYVVHFKEEKQKENFFSLYCNFKKKMEDITLKLQNIENHLSMLGIDRIEAIEQKLENVSKQSTANSESILKLQSGEVKIEERKIIQQNNLNDQQVFFLLKSLFLTINLN